MKLPISFHFPILAQILKIVGLIYPHGGSRRNFLNNFSGNSMLFQSDHLFLGFSKSFHFYKYIHAKIICGFRGKFTCICQILGHRKLHLIYGC